ncbi:NAD(P)H-binding protein [Rhodobacteraceae bacterium]|nr:NAD(P)H-binding protein [Paracoccaceae bacterium]
MTGAPVKRVAVFGATGTAGQGAVRALMAAGHDVTSIVRTGQDGRKHIVADVTQPLTIIDKFDVVVSCLASRTGSPQDAWAIDHQAHLNILKWAENTGVTHFVLLSAICVQKSELPFQHAKLAFENALAKAPVTHSIVRPTAFFKSLSGQIDRVRDGKSFLVFGNGTLTACKPISDDDLGRFIASCIDDPTKHNQILPIGGPGAAITPLNQAAALSRLLKKDVKIKRVPVAMISAIYHVLRVIGWVIPKAAEKAELARIGRYYARESMLVWDGQRYDAEATPSTGTETLFDYYAEVIAKDAFVHRGDHAVF